MARARTLVAEVTLSLDLETDPRIAVVADSHSNPHPRAFELLRREKPAAIFHAGDIGDYRVLDALAEIAPTHAVRGNIDDRDPRTPDDLAVDVRDRNGETRLRIFMTHIAVYGPRLRKDVAARARRHRAGLVFCGHSHVPFIASEGDIAVFNPGSFGPRRFHLPIVFGVLDLSASRISLRHVDCETGEAWLPPG